MATAVDYSKWEKIIDEEADKEEGSGFYDDAARGKIAYDPLLEASLSRLYAEELPKNHQTDKLKEAKKGFNTLLLKIDKGSKWRVINPAYFFARRLLTALLLTLPIENTFIFLQYVFILMSSHAYILYIVACKPYQTPGYNSYVLANETFYSALIIAIFIFSDATPELNIKIGAGVALMSSLILLILSNLVMNVSQMYFGRENIKKTIRESKLKRAEKEALEEAEEQERRLKKKKEEEEFTRLPDEAGGANSLSQTNDNNTTQGNTTLAELNIKSGKKGGKKKGDDDSLVDGNIGGL